LYKILCDLKWQLKVQKRAFQGYTAGYVLVKNLLEYYGENMMSQEVGGVWASTAGRTHHTGRKVEICKHFLKPETILPVGLLVGTLHIG
jgi:hypothetical protein